MLLYSPSAPAYSDPFHRVSTNRHKMALFTSISKPPEDFMNILKHKADTDTHLEKVDLGVGLYRNEQGSYYEFPAIKKVY